MVHVWLGASEHTGRPALETESPPGGSWAVMSGVISRQLVASCKYTSGDL